MTRARKIHWLIWALVMTIVLAGAWAHNFSTQGTHTVIRLIPTEMTQVSVFRLFPDYVRMELGFTADKTRPELGSYAYREDRSDSKTIYHPDPGEPVKLLVRNGSNERLYEAGPKSGSSAHLITRNTTPFVDDGDDRRFSIRLPSTEHVQLSRGTNTLQVSVITVGPSLLGETVSLTVTAPLGLKLNKNPAYGLGYLWLFGLWPIFAILLGIYALALHTLRPARTDDATSKI